MLIADKLIVRIHFVQNISITSKQCKYKRKTKVQVFWKLLTVKSGHASSSWYFSFLRGVLAIIKIEERTRNVIVHVVC